MKNYKVGDRVWAKEHYNIPKGFYTIRNFTNNGFFIENENGISGSVFISGIHETADSMFKELGFKLKETEEYYIYTLKKYTQWKIYISKKYGSYYVSLSDTSIAKSDHQAIHQKLIELGWIE